MRVSNLGILFLILFLQRSSSEDKKWIWESNGRSAKNSQGLKTVSRYDVFEDDYPEGPQFQRPGLGGVPPRPIPGELEGGYGQGQGQGIIHSPEAGVLTGPVPSWIKQGPFKTFDKCKCAEKFNCNSPGISYGHCDVGKQYCCYSTKKTSIIGGPLPSRPTHTVDNGVLVGPGPGGAGYGHGGRPGSFGPQPRPPAGAGFLPQNRPKPGSFGLGQNQYENGVLVGPGGPYDFPAGGAGFGYGRGGKI